MISIPVAISLKSGRAIDFDLSSGFAGVTSLFANTPITDPALVLSKDSAASWTRAGYDNGRVQSQLTKGENLSAEEWKLVEDFLSGSITDPGLPTVSLTTNHRDFDRARWKAVFDTPITFKSIDLSNSGNKNEFTRVATVHCNPINLFLEEHASNSAYLCHFDLAWRGKSLSKFWFPPDSLHEIPDLNVTVIEQLDGEDVIDVSETQECAAGGWWFVLSVQTHEGTRDTTIVNRHRFETGFHRCPKLHLPSPTIDGALLEFGAIACPCHEVRLRARRQASLRTIDGAWPTVSHEAFQSGTGFVFGHDGVELDEWVELLIPVGAGRFWLISDFIFPSESGIFGMENCQTVLDLRDTTPGVKVVDVIPTWTAFHTLRGERRSGSIGASKCKLWRVDTLPGIGAVVPPWFELNAVRTPLPELPAMPHMAAVIGKNRSDKDFDRELNDRRFREWDEFGPSLAGALEVPEEIGRALVERGRPRDPAEPLARTATRPRPYGSDSMEMPIQYAIPTPEHRKVRSIMAARELAASQSEEGESESRDTEQETSPEQEQYFDGIADADLPPSPSEIAAFHLPETASLGGVWILMTNLQGFAIFWLDHTKPVEAVIQFRPWSELGWYWKES
jgi:hypothetical protein